MGIKQIVNGILGSQGLKIKAPISELLGEIIQVKNLNNNKGWMNPDIKPHAKYIGLEFTSENTQVIVEGSKLLEKHPSLTNDQADEIWESLGMEQEHWNKIRWVEVER